MKKKKREHLPIYGVGPIYGVSIILITVLGIVLSLNGMLTLGKVSFLLNDPPKMVHRSTIKTVFVFNKTII